MGGRMRTTGYDAPVDLAAREALLRASLDPLRIPRHIAIIMDGNGRWAEIHGLSRIAGHRAGREGIRRTLEGARECGVEILTLYAFSTENWRRPPEEVQALMDLLIETLGEEAEELQKNSVRFRASGLLEEMPDEVQAALGHVMELTRHNASITLNLALNYGGRRELTEAARRLARAVTSGEVRPDEITEDVLSRFLFAPDLPDPELLIRTGGEQRLSNFLLWQAAYTELYFTDVHWPDFQKVHLFEAIASYQKRDRRFGGLDLG
jgi:undecaprenyl diphosphate synthase